MSVNPRTGKRRRRAPNRLPGKLLQIRLNHQLSQTGMLRIINPNDPDGNRARVSQYEKGSRIPSLAELLKYARIARITVETLVDDELDLPTADTGSNRHSTNEKDIGTEDKMSRNDADAGGDNEDGEDGAGKGNDGANSKDNSETNETQIPDAQAQMKEIIQDGKNDEDKNENEESEVSQNEISFEEIPIENPQHENILIPITARALRSCGETYLQILMELPPEKWSRIAFDQFIECVFAAAVEDYREHGAQSAIARRVSRPVDE